MATGLKKMQDKSQRKRIKRMQRSQGEGAVVSASSDVEPVDAADSAPTSTLMQEPNQAAAPEATPAEGKRKIQFNDDSLAA